MPRWSYDTETEEFKGDSLYFICEGTCGPIKIGRGDPASRLRTLQIGNPRKLRIMGELANVGYTEALWHQMFSDHRVRGEWFQPDQTLKSAIKWALRGEHWADEIKAPPWAEQSYYGELMLDAVDIYDDMVFSGTPETEAALKAISYVYVELSKEYADDRETVELE